MKTTQNIGVIGMGGHGAVVADAIESVGAYNLVGFIAASERSNGISKTAPYLGSDDDVLGLIRKHAIQALVVGIGDNHARCCVIERLKQMVPPEVNFPAVVHREARVCGGVTIGEGSVVLAGAVLGTGAVVGQGCIVNTSASLDHKFVMGNYASLAPGVVTGGNVKIGEGTAISIGAILHHGRSIGDWSVVGGGSLVTRDLRDGVVAYGTPAREIRERAPDDRYL